MNVKNRKRILTYVTATALGLSSVATLTACSENLYPTVEENTISKVAMLCCRLIKVKHRKTGEIKFYLCNYEPVQIDGNIGYTDYFVNVFNEEEPIAASGKWNRGNDATPAEYDLDYDLLEVYPITQYLQKYMNKEEYTRTDCMELYNYLINDEEIIGKSPQTIANETPSAITSETPSAIQGVSSSSITTETPSAITEKDENQEPINTKRVDYNTLSECILLQEHSNIDQSDKYYISKKNQDVKLQDNSAVLTIVYTNLKDDNKIVEFERNKNSSDSDYSYTEVGPLSDYLLNYNDIQIDYTMDDIDTLLKKIVKDIAKEKQGSFTK